MPLQNDYVVKPVYKALQVLQCLGEERRKMTLTEICHLVRLPKTTVFRYLYTLRECGFVAYEPETDLYWLGLRVFELAQSVDVQLQVRRVALSFMRQLRDQFNETVNLGVIDNKEVAYIEMMESRHSLRMQASLGSRDPVYSTALGKVILAFIPEEEWPNHLPGEFVPRTPNTLTSFEALKQNLIRIKNRGFSIDLQENEEGAHCIGAPIFDHLGRATAAISVSAPASRLDEIMEQQVAEALMQTAAAISHHLGYRPNGANS